MIFIARISKYEEWVNDNEIQDKLILVEGWSRDGLTQQQIADNLGINIDTLIEYKKKYPEFSDALKKGKEVVDIEVENAMLKRALGYTVRIVEQKIDKFGDVHDCERDVHIPGDVTAQIFWLKNRRRQQWRDKVEYSNDGGEISKLDEILKEIKKDAIE